VLGGTSQNIFDVNNHLRYLLASTFGDTHRLPLVLQPLPRSQLIMEPVSDKWHMQRGHPYLQPWLARVKGIKGLTLMVRNGI